MARRRSKPTPKKLAQFLEELMRNGNVTVSAEACNLERRRLYDIRQEDPGFAAAWDEAMDQAADHLEAEARRRAVGWDEPVFYEGEQIGVARKYSDTLLIFLMKGANPEKYRERTSTELSGPGGAALATAINVYLPSNGRDEIEEAENAE